MKRFVKASFLMVFVLMCCLSAIYAAPAYKVGPGWRLAVQGNLNWPTLFMGFMNEEKGITVGPSGECHYSDDSGKTWPLANNQSFCRWGIDILGDSIAWSCGNGGHIRFTKDGGKNWTAMTDCGFPANLISFFDLTTGWVGSQRINRIVVTSDGGAHWNPINTPSDFEQMSGIAMSSATSGYMLVQELEASVLYLTQDSGNTWLKQGTVCQGTLAAPTIRFFDSTQGMIIGNINGKIMGFITADGGKTWRKENVFSKVCTPFLTRDGKTLTLMGLDNEYYVLTRK